jgi:hypothetical protein
VNVTDTAHVLAFEFYGVTESADFAFLDEMTAAGRVRRVDPINDHLKTQLSLAAQARVHVRALPTPPELVIAYCSCAALGAHVAALCQARLLLVDPDAVTGQAVRREFELMCQRLGTEPPPAEEQQRQWELAFTASRVPLAELYGGNRKAFEMVDDLFDRYRAWLRFIDACATAAPAAPKNVVTVIARKPLTDLAALLAKPEDIRLRRVESASATLDAPQIQELVLAEVRATGSEGEGPDPRTHPQTKPGIIPASRPSSMA